MGRAKIKKKDTFIDMTAMSDVTVLLLTFFMLTSTFVKKEMCIRDRISTALTSGATHVLQWGVQKAATW